MPQEQKEYCVSCGAPTGKAGKEDDSLYSAEGVGPYCAECFADDDGAGGFDRGSDAKTACKEGRGQRRVGAPETPRTQRALGEKALAR